MNLNWNDTKPWPLGGHQPTSFAPSMLARPNFRFGPVSRSGAGMWELVRS